MKTSRISRLVQILTILQSGRYYIVSDLAKMLKMSRRTIFRDLRALQQAGVPCRYDKKTHGYIVDPEFFLPAPDLSTQEALGLLLLVYKGRDYIHFPFKDSALKAALKIENNLPDKIRQYCNTVLRSVSIKADPQTKMDLLDKIFTQLLKATLKKQSVSIRYYLPREHKSILTDFNPYHLLYNDHTWYVLGGSSLHKGISTFNLGQIKELNTLNKYFISDEKFNVHEYLGRAWKIRPEGRLYNVKLRFLPEVAHSVATVKWHSTQTITFNDDGSAIVEFRVDGLNEITWWVLSYGNNVQVVAPKVLRQKIIEIAQNMAKQPEQYGYVLKEDS